MLPQPHRLRRGTDIKRVRFQGQRRYHRLAILYALPNDLSANTRPVSRFTISASRRYGNAVKRNKAKRRIREVLRHQLPDIKAGWDCLFIVRSPLADASFQELEIAINLLLQQAGLL